MIKIKYAIFPIILDTWRPRKSKAIIWLQKYYLNGENKYCKNLGFFSYEFDN
jgi:hypothetical protein